MVAVRSWDAGTGTLTLFLPALYPIQAGDAFTIRPGCDKTFATCQGSTSVASPTSRAMIRSSVTLMRRVEP